MDITDVVTEYKMSRLDSVRRLRTSAVFDDKDDRFDMFHSLYPKVRLDDYSLSLRLQLDKFIETENRLFQSVVNSSYFRVNHLIAGKTVIPYIADLLKSKDSELFGNNVGIRNYEEYSYRLKQLNDELMRFSERLSINKRNVWIAGTLESGESFRMTLEDSNVILLKVFPNSEIYSMCRAVMSNKTFAGYEMMPKQHIYECRFKLIEVDGSIFGSPAKIFDDSSHTRFLMYLNLMFGLSKLGLVNYHWQFVLSSNEMICERLGIVSMGDSKDFSSKSLITISASRSEEALKWLTGLLESLGSGYASADMLLKLTNKIDSLLPWSWALKSGMDLSDDFGAVYANAMFDYPDAVNSENNLNDEGFEIYPCVPSVIEPDDSWLDFLRMYDHHLIVNDDPRMISCSRV